MAREDVEPGGAGGRAERGATPAPEGCCYAVDAERSLPSLDDDAAGLRDIAAHWWDEQDGWYHDTYNREPPSIPLARLWTAYPLFETLIGVAVAQPTKANKAALERFADDAARLYWNPYTKPCVGYDSYPGKHSAHANLYFDDSGWTVAIIDWDRLGGETPVTPLSTDAVRCSNRHGRSVAVLAAAGTGPACVCSSSRAKSRLLSASAVAQALKVVARGERSSTIACAKS